MFNCRFNTFSDFSQSTTTSEIDIEKCKQSWQKFKEVIEPAIAERTDTVKEVQKKRMDGKNKIVSPLTPGTIVWAIDNTRTSKWDPVREGPYTVVRQTDNGAYILKDATGAELP